MKQPIFANKQHEVIVSNYIKMLKDFVVDVSNDVRYKNYNDVLQVIIDYHNNYGKNVRENNYWDWLMILPINVSVMTSGYLSAIETKRNKTLVHSYRILVTEMLHDVVEKIEKLEPYNEWYIYTYKQTNADI